MLPTPPGLLLSRTLVYQIDIVKANIWLYNQHMPGWYEVDGERIKELREDHLMVSQRELADMIGSTQATISQLEGGKRKARPRTIRHLAEALGTSPRDLRRGVK